MIKERMAPVPDWACLEDGNFLILHSTKIGPDYIKEIAARLQTLLKVLEADFPFEGAPETLFVVRICKDREQYRQYGGPGRAAGYWSPNEKEMVSYFDTMARQWILCHTPSLLVHAYFAEALSPLTPHEWFSLGLSTYYAGCDLSQSGNLVPRKSPDFHPASRKAKEEGTFASLEEFLRYGRARFLGERVFENTAQAWSFVWFLKMQKDPEWSRILSAYYGALRSGAREFRAQAESGGDTGAIPLEEENRIRESALDSVFGGFDGEKWRRLEKAWLSFP